ncbi:MAG: hypothetical protein JSW65_08335 [Candidatus Bipolaricaulota bacterium]|nr:MAG: hypothetical protein JSW65_08335 [Candidatus Bipolaricaulota bacterium]
MESATADEEEAFRAHFGRLKRLRDEGRLLIAGPCLDGALGIVVFRATSEEEARRFMEEDPTIVAGLMTGELHPFRISLVATGAAPAA